MPQRPKVGIAVIITKDDQILLLKRQNSHGHGTWAPPGGHLEYGESFDECAIRETYEETGLIIATPTFRAITNDIFVEEEKHYITVWVEAQHIAGEPTVHAVHELSHIGWFTWDALPQPIFLPFQQFITDQCYPARSQELGS